MGKIVHGLYGTPEYNSWAHMNKRCNNKAHRVYHLYGGRGIQVDPTWRHDFLHKGNYADRVHPINRRASSGILNRRDTGGRRERRTKR